LKFVSPREKEKTTATKKMIEKKALFSRREDVIDKSLIGEKRG
jgi:hypothetical protein